MKTIIIGRKGIGITHLINNKIIPSLKENDFLIFDLNDEYSKYKGNCFPLMSFDIGERREKVIGMISSANRPIILDAFQAYIFPKRDSRNKLSYEWLNDMLKNKTSILTTWSVRQLEESRLDDIEKIYLFDTFDDKEIRNNFILKYKNIIEEVAGRLVLADGCSPNEVQK